MNVDEALRQFVEAAELPGAAMRWALDHWDEASPRFIARLRVFAAGAVRSEEAMEELLIHLYQLAPWINTRIINEDVYKHMILSNIGEALLNIH